MPSSPVVPKAEPTTASSAASSEAEPTSASQSGEDHVLQIDLSKPAEKLDRRLVDLHGKIAERPYWRYTADQYPDVRGRPAYTLQFFCEERDGLLIDAKRQDHVREGLWAALKDIDDLDGQPKITFDEWDNAETQSSGQVINLTFDSSNALLPVHNKVKELEVKGQDGNKLRYVGELLPSVLPGSIFILDCLNLSVDGIGVEPLLSAFKHMAKEFGTLVGMAKPVVKEKDSMFESDVDTVRIYVELGRTWVAVPLLDLVNRLPSHFVWMGRPHKLLYTGYDLRQKPLHSIDYPLGDASPAAPPSPSQPSTRKRKSQG